MEEYVLTEIPNAQGAPANEKRFRTPNGKEFIIQVTFNPGSGVSIAVMNKDRAVVNTAMVGLTNPATIQRDIELQLADAIKNAEAQMIAEESVKSYLLDTWGIDPEASAAPPPLPNPMPEPVVKFLNEDTPNEDREP